MSEHDKRRFDDDPILQIFKNWQFYGSVAAALVAIGGYIADHRMMTDAILKGQEFQTSQISINVELKTLVSAYDKRIEDLEDWRNGMDQWNPKRHH